MKKNIIDILLDSELYDDFMVEDKYSTIGENRFIELLLDYEEKSQNELHEDTIIFLKNYSPLNIYLPNKTSTNYFTKALLSMDSVIIDDEILSALVFIKDYDISSKIIDMPDNPINTAKNMVADFISHIKRNKLLFANGSIVVLPGGSEEYESNKKRKVLENSADENSLLDILPKNTINIYKKAISLTPIQRVGKDDSGAYYKNLRKNAISGELMVMIEDCGTSFVNGYMYAVARSYRSPEGELKIDYNSRVFTTPKNRTTYDNWAAGVVNRTIREHFINMSLNLLHADNLSASLAYNCSFSNRILNNINKEGVGKRKILEINTPFLNGVSPDIIAKIKNDHGESFNSYKKVLRETAFKLQLTTDKNSIDLIQREFKERVYDEGVRDIEMAIKDLRRKSITELFIESGVASVGFIDSKLTALSAISGGYGVFKTLREIKDKYRNIKSHPSYFLLKTKR